MAGNQQFCLRWNNHQSTLVSVFDTLLESGTLVDCTLAAEGQYLKAHKVVLSACSPYLEALLSQHYEKHPIIILKDVTFIELRAMLDYMYRGEVNISQDQLGTFLKAAESLHIKGLTDNSASTGEVQPRKSEPPRKLFNPPRPKSPQAFPQGLIVEPRPVRIGSHISNSNANNNNNESVVSMPHLRDGSLSPKRAKRRRSCDDMKSECGDNSDSIPSANVQCNLTENLSPLNADSAVKSEPKLEELNNDDSGDEKQYEEDEEEEMDASKPGTSQGPNSHSTGVWNTAEGLAEESFTPSGPQDQDGRPGRLLSREMYTKILSYGNVGGFTCTRCGNSYARPHSLSRHIRFECGVDPKFECPICHKKSKHKHNLMLHMRTHQNR